MRVRLAAFASGRDRARAKPNELLRARGVGLTVIALVGCSTLPPPSPPPFESLSPPAVVHLYRPSRMHGAIVSLTINVNGVDLARISNGTGCRFQASQSRLTFSADVLPSPLELPFSYRHGINYHPLSTIDLRPGESVFVRLDKRRMGDSWGLDGDGWQLERVENSVGNQEIADVDEIICQSILTP